MSPSEDAAVGVLRIAPDAGRVPPGPGPGAPAPRILIWCNDSGTSVHEAQQISRSEGLNRAPLTRVQVHSFPWGENRRGSAAALPDRHTNGVSGFRPTVLEPPPSDPTKA